ncbi:MAG: hypothetical protein LLG20_27810 [Acidobacteriales bacterium]|nr:hypothetical protein [Terriglobales bacterium]
MATSSSPDWFEGMEVAPDGWNPMYKKYVKALVKFRTRRGMALRDCAYRFRGNVRDVLPCQVQTGAGQYRQLIDFDDSEEAAAFQRAALAAIDRHLAASYPPPEPDETAAG